MKPIPNRRDALPQVPSSAKEGALRSKSPYRSSNARPSHRIPATTTQRGNHTLACIFHTIWSERTYLFRLVGLRSSSLKASPEQSATARRRSLGTLCSAFMQVFETPLKQYEIYGLARGRRSGSVPIGAK